MTYVAIYHTTKLRFLFETAKDFGRKVLNKIIFGSNNKGRLLACA